MNSTVKTILLTVLTLSVFVIALVELSGISSNAFFNKFGSSSASAGPENIDKLSPEDQAKRDLEIKNLPKTSLDVVETKFDFGHIKEGDKVRHTWVVKNTGANPLMISNVQTSCGCTVPSFAKEPIKPGAEGTVTLEFNSAGKPGTINKNALIIANTDNSPFSIGFTAEVEKK